MATNIKRKTYPDWVEKHHIKGTSIKQIRDNYYLYSSTSKYIKGRPYPIGIQHYIGKITKDGLIEPEKINFVVSRDKLALLQDKVDLSKYDDSDLKLIANLPIIVIANNYYATGAVSSLVEKVLKKHLNYSEGYIYG